MTSDSAGLGLFEFHRADAAIALGAETTEKALEQLGERSRPSAEANPAKWDAVRMHDTQNHAGSVPTATKPAQLAWPPFGGREPCFIPTPAYRIKQ